MFGIAVITFFAIRLVPGDVVDVMLGEYNDPEIAAELRRHMGIDRPVHVQFVEWLEGLLRGDLGYSFRTGEPVTSVILQRLPATLELATAALIISLLVALPVGVLSAIHRNSIIDVVARLISMIGISMPHFWLGILLILFLSVELRILPSGGYAPLNAGVEENLKFLLMPAVTLGLGLAAVTMRMTRSAMLEVLGQAYIRTARAKGLKEMTVIFGHALKNALIPVVTIIGIQIGRLLGGAVVIEEVFSWPGVGSMVVRAIFQRDYPLVQGIVMILSFFFVCGNLIVDILYVYIDPRLHGE
jgi:peptide/nickel transport system permease protein